MKHLHSGSRQKGAVLMVSLMFLVILTMLGVTAMSGTTMEERMAGNTRDASIALQAAEAGLRDARRDISNLPARAGMGRAIPIKNTYDFGDASGTPGSCGSTGLCLPSDPNHAKKPPSFLPPTPTTHSLKGSPAVAYGTITGASPLGALAASSSVLAFQPHYLIEGFCLMDPGETLAPQCNFYRITARGYGRNPNSMVTLQEVFLAL